MCFSAGASFGASAVLSIIGTAAIMKARTVPQGLFAGIPMIFSVQQLAEGFLWLSLKEPHSAGWQSFSLYTFLFFALMAWPVWIPLTIGMLEKDAKRKKILKLLLFAGVVVSVAAGCTMLFYAVEVMQAGHHLHYSIHIPPETKKLIKIFTFLYLATTIFSAFSSSIKEMKWLGIVFLLSYGVTILFYNGSVISVWCYFAALLSMIVLWILSGLQKPADK